MAGAVTRGWLADRNPLKITGTALPPNLLLAAKLIVLALILKDYVGRLPSPFLPLLPVFDALPNPDLFRRLLQAVFWIAAVALFANVRVRTAALLAGVVFLIGPLSARGTYTNGKFFCAAMLILISLYHARYMIWLVRAQFSVMYAGSGLNKLFEPDWLDGRYMDYWLGTIRDAEPYHILAAWLPPMTFATLLGWGTIVIELGLAVALLRPRWYRPAIWTAILMHASSAILAGHDYSVFLSALLAAFLVFVEWPERGTVVVKYHQGAKLGVWLRGVASRAHLDELFRWQSPALDKGNAVRLRLELNGRCYDGIAALNVWLLLNPFTYVVLAVLIIPDWRWLLDFGWDREWIREWTLVGGIFWFFPATAWVVRSVGALRTGDRPANTR